MNRQADPKQDQAKAAGGSTQQSAYPLDRYTVAPSSGDNDKEKSPYYKSAAPTISLPKGGGALKGIDEKFTVNTINGTASLQVPFPLTPGRGGFTPGLSIDYNSGAGNSEFGLGFSLSLPSIQRKTDKRLPQYDDQHDGDIFLLAGAEDLVPKLDLNTSTANWDVDADNDLVAGSNHYTIKRYRPRIEGLFARVEHISKHGGSGSWWKVTTKDNIVTFYGLTAEARLSDPQNANRIFKWLPQVSYDNKGNVIQYYYFSEDLTGVSLYAHESNRISGLAPFSNVYLKRVKYCIRTPYYVSADNAYDVSSVLPDPDTFLMECVLDYGNHHATVPTPVPDSSITLPARKDPYSDFHAGFEVRTYRRCMRVLMFHYFDEMDGGNPVLVRSLDFAYHLGATPADFAEADFITSVTQSGYLQKSDHTYIKKSLPPVTMTYEPLQWDNTVHNVSREDAQNAPQGLTGPYQWIDLWGEGLPGILTEQANGWFYKRNLGDGHFEPALSIAPKPSLQGLGSNLQWQDLDADGRRQLVSRDTSIPGYFELDDDQQWQPFRQFKDWVNVDWNSPYTKVLDLNGDGRPDVLLTEERAWRWYESEGSDGYSIGGESLVTHDEERGPRMLVNDMVQAIFLADMNGDGLTDIVRIQNGEVCYWPNMGYGRFGAKVAMTNAPFFDLPDIFNPMYITLADISGTGAPDLIYLGHNKCTAWINYAGNAWGDAVDIFPLPAIDQLSKVTVADFLGNGTACIVWSSPLPQHAYSPMRYIDLMGGKKPFLMKTYSNGIGKSVELTYKQSTKYYLEDRLAGKPWATRLPFPVHCVSEITTTDSVSQTTYTQQYSYHHGYYDHEEREFRGFGRVDAIDTDTANAFQSDGATPNNLDQFPVLTKTWNHTGAWMRESTLLNAFAAEYYPLTGGDLPTAPELPAGLSPQEQREAYRALKGQPLRQEVYALDGTSLQPAPYTVATHAYAVNRVQPLAENRYASFLSFSQQTLTWSCERNAADPRVMHALTLAVDKYGNVLKSASVAYPRVAASIPSGTPTVVVTAQQQMLITYSTAAFTNDILTGGYHLRVGYEAQSYEIARLSHTGLWTVDDLQTAIDAIIGTASDIEFAAAIPASGAYRRMLSHSRSLFLSDDTTTVLNLGVIESLCLPYNQYQLAFTDGTLTGADYYNSRVTDAMLVEGAYLREDRITEFASSDTTRYWISGGTIQFSTTPTNDFFSPVTYTDPWGNITSVTYWDTSSTNYYMLPQSVTDAVSNTATVTAYNWYNLQPTSMTDANSNISEILFDALGMPVAMALKGKGTEADALGSLDPHSSGDLSAQASFWTSPVSNAPTLLGSATWRCVYNLSASPVRVAMIGREIHDADVVSANPLIIRFTYTDGFGRIAMNKVQAGYAEGSSTDRWVGNGKIVYNNKGKAVMQYEPYFSSSHAYDAAEAAAVVGVTPRIHYDAPGRVVRTDMPDGSYSSTGWDAWMQSISDGSDNVTGSDWAAARSTGGSLVSDTNEVDALTKATNHIATPTIIHLDTLARPFYTIQHDKYPNTSGTWTDHYYESYAVLDIAGDRLAMVDARGITVLTYTYNMLKAPVRQVSVDSGTRVLLNDAANQPLYAWDADARKFHFTYDALRRPLTKEVAPSGSSVLMLQQTTYGEGVTGATTYNLNGQVYESYDGTGYKKIVSYDFKGNPLQVDEQLLTDYTITDVDWAASPALNSETFTTQTAYDALSRPVTATDPGGNVITHAFDVGGALFSVTLTPSGGSSTGYVTGIYYDAKGQRDTIYYGNGTKTAYSYDALTYRLRRLLTTKSGNTYQDLNYWYDPVGNITKLKDASQRALYFNNSVTLPQADYTYDALYRLIIATGREQIVLATFGSNDNFNDSPWMGIPHPGDDLSTQNYTQKYAYDEVGNINELKHIASSPTSYTRSYGYLSGTNRLDYTTVGSNTYSVSHDNRGNITAMPHLSSITFNASNEMSVANLGGGGTAYYQYRGGQRSRKVTANGANVEERIYLGSYEIYRKFVSSSLTLERTTVHVSDDTGRIAMLEVRTLGTDPSPASLTRYIYSNHLSTTTLELDDSAAVISYEEYHPYGTTSYQASNASINAVAKRYRYTGKERDEETGLYYHGARYYAPWLTRWCAADPLESKFAPESCYNYGHCNPITWQDSTGMAPADPPGTAPTGSTDEATVRGQFQNKLDEIQNGNEVRVAPDFKKWAANFGIDDIVNLRNQIYDSKIHAFQVGMDAGPSYDASVNGPNEHEAGWGMVVPNEVKVKLWEESNKEAIPAFKAAWAAMVSWADPTSVGYKFNPLARANFISNLALTVSNRGEGRQLLGHVAFNVGTQWLFHLTIGGGTSNLIQSAKKLTPATSGRPLEVLEDDGIREIQRKSFEEYKRTRGGTETLTQIPTKNAANEDVLQRISTEYAHIFIKQRHQRLYDLPNWMVNNRVNVWKINTVQHALIDPYRYNFLRAGFKPSVGWFGEYNWFTKFSK